MSIALTLLSLLALVLLAWQWAAGARFPLHRRAPAGSFASGLTILKPVKGCDEHTEACLRSWFAQEYSGPVQLLIGAAEANDPVCAVAKRVLTQFPDVDAELILCEPLQGVNSKVAKLALLTRKAKHNHLVISDADVVTPPDLLSQLVLQLADETTGLVNCFYRMADAKRLGMKWEVVATNADFWSQVLQSNGLRPMHFALGAVMALRREVLDRIGGFEALADCVADDYQLGYRIAATGRLIRLSPVVVECRSGEMNWKEVWKHQLRWARTIRACQPVSYLFSILSNASLWPMLLFVWHPTVQTGLFTVASWAVRVIAGLDLQRRLEGGPAKLSYAPVVLLKDFMQVIVWVFAFLGNTVEWGGDKMVLRRGGMAKVERPVARSVPSGACGQLTGSRGDAD